MRGGRAKKKIKKKIKFTYTRKKIKKRMRCKKKQENILKKIEKNLKKIKTIIMKYMYNS